MRQHGRKSFANRDASSMNGGTNRLEPPEFLSKPEQALFRELVTACAPEHFRPADLPLLGSFCQAVILSRAMIANAATDKDAALFWERSAKLAAALATKLRITPQARLDPKALARQDLPRHPAPWVDR